MRPPDQEFQSVMGFGEHPAVGHREVTGAVRFHDPPNFGQMPMLRIGFTHMLDDVVGDDYVKASCSKRKLDTLDLLIGVTICTRQSSTTPTAANLRRNVECVPK